MQVMKIMPRFELERIAQTNEFRFFTYFNYQPRIVFDSIFKFQSLCNFQNRQEA